MIKGNDERSWGTFSQHRNDPVFEVDFEKSTVYPNGDKLPNIWVTEPIFDDDGHCDGRTYTMLYPYFDHLLPNPGPLRLA